MKSVFSYNSDINKNAILNWRTDKQKYIQNLNILADGYLEGASILLKDCIDDNASNRADGLIFPIIFSINHGIELYEKSICWSLNVLLDTNDTFDSTHNIFSIWKNSKKLIIKFGFNDERTKNSFDTLTMRLEQYLNEMANTICKNQYNNKELENSIFFSRYPFDKKYDNYFYIDKIDNVNVDLENLLEICLNIKNGLSVISEYYCELADEKLTLN